MSHLHQSHFLNSKQLTKTAYKGFLGFFPGLGPVDHYTSLHITAITLVFGSQELEK